MMGRYANSTLDRRLRKLEVRIEVAEEPMIHLIRLVAGDGTVTDALTLQHGQRGWRQDTYTQPAGAHSPNVGSCR